MIIHALPCLNWPQPCIIDYHIRIGLFELDYLKSLMKSSMKLTGGGNIYDQNTRNLQY